MKTYLVWCPDYGQDRSDARSYKANDRRMAAEDWAMDYDRRSADYMIVGGNDATVIVAEDIDGSEELGFIVSGETVAHYRARATVRSAE